MNSKISITLLTQDSAPGEQLSSLVVSRKRKAWEGLHSGGSKGGPGRRDEEEEDVEKEEEEQEEGEEEEEGSRQWEEEEPDTHHAHLAQTRPSHHGLLSPLNNHFGNEEVRRGLGQVIVC